MQTDTDEFAELFTTVRRLAAQMARHLPRHVELEDLVSAGYEGLLDATRRYATLDAAQFALVARSRIRGAMRDALRALDPLPRRTRAKVRSLGRAERALGVALGRSPSLEELASKAGVTPSECGQLRVQARACTVDIEDAHCAGRASLAPDRLVTEHELVQRLDGALQDLPARDVRVIRELYFEGRTLREIGSELGVTEARVCQLHARALSRLRERLGDVQVSDAADAHEANTLQASTRVTSRR